MITVKLEISDNDFSLRKEKLISEFQLRADKRGTKKLLELITEDLTTSVINKFLKCFEFSS